MQKSSIIYEEKQILTAKFCHPKSDDYLTYETVVRVYSAGKKPIEIIMKFNGIPPFVAPMPPENHAIKVASIMQAQPSIAKWFKKYGYILK